jgi:quercetin dioxygenase-like cupin family protein
MSHPERHGPPDRTPIQVGEVWEDPVTRERATILERPWDNPAGRVTAELTALVGARVFAEHQHPALVEQFTVLEGELTVKREEHTSILHQGETAVIEPGVWHDWWNAGVRDARCTGGGHTRRTVRAYDRDLLRPRAPRAHRR